MTCCPQRQLTWGLRGCREEGMKLSMNGFRRNLSGDVQELRDVAAAIVNDDWYEKADLVEAVNAVITHGNVLNCIFSKDDPDFTDMSDLEVEHLDEETVE